MNDPVALLLVIGFIEWIQEPGFGARRHGRAAGAETGGRGGGRGRASAASRSAPWTAARLPTDGIYPVATIAIAALSYGLAEVAHGSGFLAVYLTALALGSAPHSRPPHRRRLPRGPRLGRPDRPLHPARPARLPEPARRRGAEGPGALGGADLRRPAAGDLRSPPPSRRSTCASGDARLGRAARGDADLAGDLPGRRRGRRRRGAVLDRLLRRRQLDPGPGGELRAAGDPARADDRRAGAAAPAARVGADPRAWAAT